MEPNYSIKTKAGCWEWGQLLNALILVLIWKKIIFIELLDANDKIYLHELMLSVDCNHGGILMQKNTIIILKFKFWVLEKALSYANE